MRDSDLQLILPSTDLPPVDVAAGFALPTLIFCALHSKSS